jgi:protoporphyrinogen oxidase
LERRYPGLHLAGRNGMHKYNNQDHAMMTGMLTARNIVGGHEVYDVWKVNQDAQYLEGGRAGDARMVPTPVRPAREGRRAPPAPPSKL